MIPLYCGFDQREAAAYHVFCQSVIQTATSPVAFYPLALKLLPEYTETHTDGSNQFIYSRFLVPFLQDYRGWAIFADGDMLCRADISELWAMRDQRYAVMVAKHNYTSKAQRKYIGTSLETHNAVYPRKNWSSVMLWNCGHPANRILTPKYVEEHSGRVLHRFEHLHDEQIGDLPREWNWLASEYEHNPDAKLVHYTLGVPGMEHYKDCDHSAEWHLTKQAVNHIEA
jgi:lipopolysaccharide biosynthesis glycosyltransferase